jgi:hypothetical protein
MKTQHQEIIKIVKSHRLIKERIKVARDNGYDVIYRSMGSGGVLQQKEGRGCTYIQIGYGSGRYNFAPVVKINIK